jgi:uncharacterized OB-fold protein
VSAAGDAAPAGAARAPTPLPAPGPDDRAFWDGCRRHVLLVQQCLECGALRFWGQPMCESCTSVEAQPLPASGRGTIWSFTTTHHAFAPAWTQVVPYTIVVVRLDEGPRMTSTLVGADPADVRIGLPVEVVFEDVTPEVTLPRFRLVRPA